MPHSLRCSLSGSINGVGMTLSAGLKAPNGASGSGFGAEAGRAGDDSACSPERAKHVILMVGIHDDLTTPRGSIRF